MAQDDLPITTDIPARLDRLPWGRFHTLVVIALGITWILDGLEVTLAGSLAGALKESPSLRFSNTDIGLASSAYLAGAVLGAILFGWLTDRLGRKKLFFLTLAVYLTATAATAFSWNIASFAFFRFLTGAGIGGEYSAINSTIQELVPARVRGWTDLIINGSFWIGAAIGALGSLVLLDPQVINPDFGWRLGFLIGAGLACLIFLMRFWIPESPRWLITHGRAEEAEKVIADIESRFSIIAADASGAASQTAPATFNATALGDGCSIPATSAPDDRWSQSDGVPGVLLQCNIFHLCADSYRLLWRRGGPGRLVHPAVCDWQFSGPPAARPFV